MDAIKAGTLIGPEPGRRQHKDMDKCESRSLAGGGLEERLPDSLMMEDGSVSGLRVKMKNKKRASAYKHIMISRCQVSIKQALHYSQGFYFRKI